MLLRKARRAHNILMDLVWLALIGLLEAEKGGALLRKLKARDPQAMAELYDGYSRILYAVILRMVNNPGVAEDLLQETFLRAWNRAAQLSEDYVSVGPWVLSIARHCALDYLKSSQARLSAQVEIDESVFPPTSMEHELITSDQARLLADAFRRLTPHQRTVLELAYYEGLSQTAIAERLHQPLGTVKGWTRLALQKLRSEIDRSQFQLA